MAEPIDRRRFLVRMSKGGLAVAVLGVAACSADEPSVETTGPTTTPPVETVGPATSGPVEPTTTTAAAQTPTTTEPTVVEWQRVALGNFSAYLVMRAGEAAIVDTGIPGSAGAIEAALTAIGGSWDAVSNVFLTHLHPDHVGSIGAVLEAAPAARAFAGAADIPSIASPRPITAVTDGERIFDLTMIATPGHTEGHISVLDPAASVLVAGDALVNTEGLSGSNPRFTADVEAAADSVRKLASFEFDTILFGHGDPITAGGSSRVAELVAGS